MEHFDRVVMASQSKSSSEVLYDAPGSTGFAHAILKRPQSKMSWFSLRNNELSELSDSSIANKILFRRTYSLRRSDRWEGFLEGKTRTGIEIAVPVRPLVAVGKEVFADILSNNFCIYPLDEDAADFVAKAVSGAGTSKADRSQSDYLYSTARLSSLSGPELSGHRYKVGKLERNHKLRVENIHQENLALAKQVLDTWLMEKNSAGCSFDHMECRNALNFLEQMNLSGFLFFVDEIPSALSILDSGFKNMAVSLFQKVIGGHKGLDAFCVSYQANAFKDKRYLNLCQDLGIPGLRMWKESFHPDRIVDKYIICRAH